ncbi:glycosyltransferase family 2 protein [Thermoproteota archaeon]
MSDLKTSSVTVSVNTFNRPDALSVCLSSLNRQTDKDFKVVIVNGGELEPLEDLIKKYPLSIKVICQQKRGLVEARNLCWKNANTDIVCIIDDDLVVSDNWLKEIKDTFSSAKNIGGVTGPTVIPKSISSNRDAIAMIDRFERGNLFWRIIGNFYLNFILEGRVRDVGKILDCGTFSMGSNYPDSFMNKGLIEVDYLEACHMCFRKDLISQAGGFDYCYTGTGEWSEPDLAFKINKMGYKLIFNPKASTEHRVSQQGVYKARTYAFERSVNFIQFYFRHIKPNTLNRFLRFYSYIAYMNFYWIYKAITTRNINWLTGLSGTISALWRNICCSYAKQERELNEK